MRCQEIDFQITWGIEWISTPQTTWATGSTYGDRNVILCTSFFFFQLPYQPAPKEVADKVMKKSKNK